MDERVPMPSGQAYLLNADEETLKRLHECSCLQLSIRAAAREFGVHPQTLSAFLDREPAAGQAFWGQKKARRNAKAAAFRAQRALLTAGMPRTPWAAASGDANVPRDPHAPPPENGVCHACGRGPGSAAPAAPDVIVLSAAELAQAREELDAIIDRHIAAKQAERKARKDARQALKGQL